MPLSDLQCKAVGNLERLVTAWFLPPFPPEGRGEIKARALIDALCTVRRSVVGEPVQSSDGLSFGPFVADRANFLKDTLHFDVTPHISVFGAAAYIEPRLLEIADRCVVSDAAWHALKKARPAAITRELVAYARKWDRHGKLHLFLVSDVDIDDMSDLMAVWKSASEDRVVSDRRRRNAKEVHLAGASKDMPSGADLVDFEVPRSWHAVAHLDDLQDFYPSFDGSIDRARTNALRVVACSDAFLGIKALRECKHLQGCRVVPGLKGAVMGNKNLVDWAQEAHSSILDKGVSFPVSSRILPHRPFPRHPWVEFLIIDDHGALAAVAPSSSKAPAGMTASFEKGSIAVEEAGLKQHASKRVRDSKSCVLVGQELQGRLNLLGASRHRRFLLSQGSWMLARYRIASGALTRKLTATWTYVCCSRRPTLCILDRSFKDQPSVPDDDKVFKVSIKHATEMLILAVLAPLLVAEADAGFSDLIFCSDAPLARGVACKAHVPVAVHREIYRHRERRGAYTFLHSAAAQRVWASGSELEQAELAEAIEPLEGPDPERLLAERFDVICVCCGVNAPLLTAMAKVGLRTGPKIDIAQHRLWDIRQDRIILWLIFLIRNGRLWYLHLEVPCTDFSTAKRPYLRSKHRPFGFVPDDPARAKANSMLLRGFLLLFLIKGLRSMHGSHEHPKGAFSWYTPQAVSLFSPPRGSSICFAMCAYGEFYRKLTRLGLIGARFLEGLEAPCPGFHKHVPLRGRATTRVAEYGLPLVTKWADLTLEAWKVERPDVVFQERVEAGRSQKPCFETIWLNDVMASSSWSVVMNAAWPRSRAHVNVLELNAHLQLLCSQAPIAVRRKQSYFLDSRVAIGVLAKGRSAAPALNAPLKLALPYVLGFSHYPGYGFSPTRLNVSDDPSRGVALRSARRSSYPRWFGELAEGRTSDFDYWAKLPRQSRATSEWARFAAHLSCKYGREFSSDEDGDGPFLFVRFALLVFVLVGFFICPAVAVGRKQRFPLEARLALDLVANRNLTPLTLSRRKIAVSTFEVWLSRRHHLTLAQLVAIGPASTSKILAEFGQHLYDTGPPLYILVEAINGIVDMNRSWRRSLQAAWDVVDTWDQLIPTMAHVPIPISLLQAMVALALFWNWIDVALLLPIAFAGMLRPSEYLKLTRNSIILPSDMLHSFTDLFFVKLVDTKTRRFMGRFQHVRISEIWLTRLLEAMITKWPPKTKLWPGTPYQFRLALNQLLKFFGVPCQDGEGITPASFRGGGASWYYLNGQSLDWIQWQGRWRQAKTLEIYVQEMAVHSFLAELPQAVRDKISRFSCAAVLVTEVT